MLTLLNTSSLVKSKHERSQKKLPYRIDSSCKLFLFDLHFHYIEKCVYLHSMGDETEPEGRYETANHVTFLPL